MKISKLMLSEVLATYKCLITSRAAFPGLRLEDVFNAEALESLKQEYEWLGSIYDEGDKDNG